MADGEKTTSSTRDGHRDETAKAADPRVPHHHHNTGGSAACDGAVDHPIERRDMVGTEGRGRVAEPMEGLPFEEALRRLRQGKRVARAGWNGLGQWLGLQLPDRSSLMTRPYIYIRTVQGDLVPWLASQTDLLMRDWCEVTSNVKDTYGNGWSNPMRVGVPAPGELV